MPRFSTNRPERFGRIVRFRGGQHSEETLARGRAKRAKEAAQRMDALKQEILEFLADGGPSKLRPEERASRSALATSLMRRGIVNSTRNEQTIVAMLVSLARARKLELPKKSKLGGSRKKKK